MEDRTEYQTSHVERWVTVQEATDILSKSDRTIYRWIDEDKVAHRREGRRIYVDIGKLAPAARPDVLDTVDVDRLRQEVVALRAKVDSLVAINDNLENERDYLRGQNTFLMQLKRPVLEEPAERRGFFDRLLGRE